jgi:hypothetical protein
MTDCLKVEDVVEKVVGGGYRKERVGVLVGVDLGKG